MTQHRPPPKKMAGLSWTAVTLSLLLYVGNCSVQRKGPDQNQHEGPDQNQHEGPDQNQHEGPDQNQFKGPSLTQLKELVDKIWNYYMPSYKLKNKNHFPMFSAAVSIPYDNNKKKYDVSGITDPAEKVKARLLTCEVYKGERMLAATLLKWPDVLNQCPDERVQWPDVLKKCRKKSMTWAEVDKDCPGAVRDGRTDHAEYRTLTAFSTLTKKLNKNDFMLFYVLSSPCVSKCTSIDHGKNILERIKEITKWDNYAVVFSNVFMAGGPQSDEKERKEALVRLGKSIGLNNIIRCDAYSCSRCYNSEKKEVVPHCYQYPDKSAPSNNLPSTSFIEMRNDL